jgi:hypothetical protein
VIRVSVHGVRYVFSNSDFIFSFLT